MYNMVLDGFYFSYSLCEINDVTNPLLVRLI